MILLDTHAVLWLNSRPALLSRRAAGAIRRAAASDGLAIASISLWEIAQLAARGRIRIKDGRIGAFLEAIVRTPGLAVLGIDAAIATQSAQLPPGFPGDPADRLIVATARVHGLSLVTRDEAIRDSKLARTIW